MSKEEILGVLIKKIKEYLEDPKIIDKNFNDFMKMNKEIFLFNIFSIDELKQEDIALIFNTVSQNLETSDEDIIEIFKYSQCVFEKEVVVVSLSGDLYFALDDLVLPFYKMIFEHLNIIMKPKVVFYLKNDKKTNIIKTETFPVETSSIINNTRVVPVNYRFSNLFNMISENYQKFSFNKNHIEFGFMSRNVGVNISKSKLKLNYRVQLDVGNKEHVLVEYRINDNINSKYMELDHEGKNMLLKTDFSFQGNTFKTLCKAFIEKIPQMKDPLFYSSLISAIEELNNYYDLFLKREIFLQFTKLPAKLYRFKKSDVKMVQFPDIWSGSRQVHNKICVHENELKSVMKIDPNFYAKVQKFMTDYITTNDEISSCKLCGTLLPMFNIEFSEIRKIRGKIIMPVITNIFTIEPYSQFNKSQKSISDFIMSFDSIFKSSRWSFSGYIYKTILDYLLELNSKKVQYQNMYKAEVEKGVFFFSLTSTIFESYHSDSDFFHISKNMNVAIIMIMIIMITCNTTEIINIMHSRKETEKFIKDSSDSETFQLAFKEFMGNVIFECMKRIKMATKEEEEKIKYIFNFYIKHLNLELQTKLDTLIDSTLLEISLSVTKLLTYDYSVNTLSQFTKNIAPPEYFPNDFTHSLPSFNKKVDSIQNPIYFYEEKVGAVMNESSDLESEFEYIKNNMKLLILYKGMPVNYYKDIEGKGLSITTNNNKKKFLDYEKLYSKQFISYKSNLEFAFLKLGDPYPLGERIRIEHINLKVHGYNFFFIHVLNTGCPISYFPEDSKDGWFSRNRLEFWFYQMVKSFLDGDIKTFLESKKDQIIQYYENDFINK